MVTAVNNYDKIQNMINTKINWNSTYLQTLKLSTSVATQTGINDDLCITLSQSKKIQLYYSKSYKENVLSFNLGKSKKFTLNKKNWLVFRKFLYQIDYSLTK